VNLLGNADAAVKTQQIGAAAEERVLAIVDDLIHARMKVRRSPPAQVTALLNQLHAQTGLGQGAGRAHSGHAAADVRNGLLRVLLRTAQSIVHFRRKIALPAGSTLPGSKSLFSSGNKITLRAFSAFL
jgi:pyrroline-5-carboxylate reductase